MHHEEQDDLWKLLGRAKEPEVSPFFSRNVLRAIREEQQERTGLAGWLRRRWAVATIAGCTACAAVALLVTQSTQPDPLTVIASQVSASPDYQVISHLDELLDSEESSVWLDSPVY